jgi:hypothetical protein
MTNEVNFDALTIKADQSNGAMEDLIILYGAAFALSEWHFISRGEMPNVSPYIASNAQYADGQPMIRAFTDTKRLIRFAQENNLTRTDGTCNSLSIPTEKIVEYLEQFIADGAYGVWFNSDTGSEGFFVPLEQLRPIKEHLEKINRKNNTGDSSSAPIESRSEPDATVDEFSTLIEENAELIAGYDEENATLSAIIAGYAGGMETLSKEEKAVRVSNCAKMFDGFRGDYKMSSRLFEFFIEFCMEKRKFIIPVMAFGMCLRQEDKVRRLEQDEELNKELARWITVKLVPIADILLPPVGEQAEESPDSKEQTEQSSDLKEQARQSSNLRRLGFSTLPNGEFDINLNLFQKGAVNFDTSIAPLYQAVFPLLEDYRGLGEYTDLLSLDANLMHEKVENIASNSHGACLRIRRFLYPPGGSGMGVGINTIDSSDLRHIQTQSSLLVNFALVKNIANQTASLYYRFQGAKSEVSKLQGAVLPILQDCGFKASS